MATTVAIIGVGELGGAVKTVLQNQPNIVLKLWDKREGAVPNQEPLENVVREADVVCICVPSWVMRAAVKEIAPYIPATAIVVSLAKGIERESQKTMDAILAEELPQHVTGVLGGPMLAEELAEGLPGAALVAMSDPEANKVVTRLFAETPLRVYGSTDRRGVAVAGVLKNVFAIGLGVGDGLGRGNNFRGWFISQALVEMANVLEILGCQRATAYSVSGLGDMVATGTSPNSTNYHTGQALAHGESSDPKSEGAASLAQLRSLLGDKRKDFPLLEAVAKVVVDGQGAKEVFTALP